MASHKAAMSRQRVRLDPMTAALAATPPSTNTRQRTWRTLRRETEQPDGLGCIQVGYHIDFTPIELWERYGSQQNYIDEVAGITCKAKRDGFLVSADADRTIEEAKTVKISAAGS